MISKTSNKDLMTAARNSLHQHFSTIILAFLAVMGITIVASYIPFGSIVIGGPLTVGFALIALMITQKKSTEVKNLFDPFNNFAQILLAYLIYSFVTFLAVIVSILPIIFAVFYSFKIKELSFNFPAWEELLHGFSKAKFIELQPQLIDEIMQVFFSYIGFSFIVYLFMIAVIMYYIIRFSMMFYIAADKPKVTAIDMIKEGWQILENNMGKYLLLHLRFVGWYLLTPFTFGILLFYVIPYQNLAIANFYEDIKEPISEDAGNNDTEKVFQPVSEDPTNHQ